MVYTTIQFIRGYVYTLEEVKHLLCEDTIDDEIVGYSVPDEYRKYIHSWACCTKMDKMFVVGEVIHKSHRKHVNCKDCTLFNIGKCKKCKQIWKNRVGHEPALKCEDCLAKDPREKYLENSSVCDVCIGSTIDGVFDIIAMQNSIVTFDGFTKQEYQNLREINSKEYVIREVKEGNYPLSKHLCDLLEKDLPAKTDDARATLCFYCKHPNIKAKIDDVCPFCLYKGYENSTLSPVHEKFIKKHKLPVKPLHIVAVPDDCLSCT